MQFDAPPSLWSAYARVLWTRKPASLAPGETVPRIEARLTHARADAAHLARYRAVCGLAANDPAIPLAYPHVLASSLHLELLSSAAFPVRLLGLVHVRNRIEQQRPLTSGDAGPLCTWLDGCRHTARGQEFDLQSEWQVDGVSVWRETCTFLARAPRARGALSSEGAASAPTSSPEGGVSAAAPGVVHTTSLRAEAGLGLRYGIVSGDLNPIHLSDVSARMFGFRAAIAHGMWSLARCTAELPPPSLAGPLCHEIEFRAPVFLPAWLMLHRWQAEEATAFELRDGQGERVHLRGTIRPLR